jgi:RNA polymerase sigma factor (sigma-70 family)
MDNTSIPPEDFAPLLARARLGDEGALAQLARQYEPEVRRAIRARLSPDLRRYVDPTDLVLSVHRVLLLGIRQNKFDLSVQENLVALAVTIVRRKIARHWRTLQRERRIIGRQVNIQDVEEKAVSPDGAELASVLAAEVHDQVHRLLLKLNDRDRRLMERHLQGQSTAAIAREWGEDAGVLRVRLSRIRQRLRGD